MRTRAIIIGLLAVAAMAAVFAACGAGTSKAGAARAASTEGANMETATFGAGCFWHVQGAFQQIEGVADTVVGYEGGTLPNPTYRDVCSHRTGHAEVTQVTYDAEVVSYEDLLEVFWQIHNPTQLDRQGPDVGEQYRSIIFYHTSEQQAAAEASRDQLADSGRYERRIVTRIQPAMAFWRAEEYHQDYVKKHGIEVCPIPGLK